MELRRVLKFNGTLGFTLPAEFSRLLKIHWKDYVEIYFVDPDKVVVKKYQKPRDFTIQNVK